MTVDLKTQLRDYTEFFMSTIDAVEIGEIPGLTAEVCGVVLTPTSTSSSFCRSGRRRVEIPDSSDVIAHLGVDEGNVVVAAGAAAAPGQVRRLVDGRISQWAVASR